MQLADGSGDLVLSFGQSKLSWSSVAGASEYAVYRSDGHVNTYSEITRVTDPTTSYDDEHNTERQIFSYKIAAVDNTPVIGKRTQGVHTSGLNTNL